MGCRSRPKLFWSGLRVLFIIFFIACVSGCITAKKNTTLESKNLTYFWYGNLDGYTINGKVATIMHLSLDGVHQNDPAIIISPGPHKIETVLRWSNRWKERRELAFEVLAGHNYVLGTYELTPGQDLVNVVIKRETPTYISGWQIPFWAIAYPVIVIVVFGGSLVLLPVGLIALSFELLTPTPTDVPFKDCCFVWIEDVSTNQVVAGAKP
jgi:hypothetical protein